MKCIYYPIELRDYFYTETPHPIPFECDDLREFIEFHLNEIFTKGETNLFGDIITHDYYNFDEYSFRDSFDTLDNWFEKNKFVDER